MLSDEKGYAFTPLTLLLFIPIVILAISYGNIVSEANMLANIATGGHVTYTVSKDIINNMKVSSERAGRNASYAAVHQIIDNYKFGKPEVFFSKTDASKGSKAFLKRKIAKGINDQLINTTIKLAEGTGRTVEIKHKRLTNNPNEDYIVDSDLEIYQTEPFGYYVTIKPILIKVEQEGQVYIGETPDITGYVSIEGLEDPYIWVNTDSKMSNVFYRYPYYSNKSGTGVSGNIIKEQYFFDNDFNASESDSRLHYLWECLNGTDNPSGITTPRPYYFPDSETGLSFFDRLENKTLKEKDPNEEARMNTFVLGDPLFEADDEAWHNAFNVISSVDTEYFNNVRGYKVVLYNKTNGDKIGYLKDPSASPLVLSSKSIEKFNFRVNPTKHGTEGTPSAEVWVYV